MTHKEFKHVTVVSIYLPKCQTPAGDVDMFSDNYTMFALFFICEIYILYFLNVLNLYRVIDCETYCYNGMMIMYNAFPSMNGISNRGIMLIII